MQQSGAGLVSNGSKQDEARLFARFAALGDRARDARMWFIAAVYYEEALHLDPGQSPYWVQYGHALKESGERMRAEAAYRRALALDPTNADTHLNLGHLLKILERPHEALESYANALELAPEDGEIIDQFARLKSTM